MRNEGRRPRALILGATLLIAAARPSIALAQQVPAASPSAPGAANVTVVSAERVEQSFTLRFFNRQIVVLRARVLGRTPIDRAIGAHRILDDLVSEGITGPVSAQPFPGGTLLRVDTHSVLGLTSADVDDLSGETLEGVAALTVTNLQRALNEAAEARAPGRLIRAAAAAFGVLLLAALVLWASSRVRQIVVRKLIALSEQQVAKVGSEHLTTLRASRLLDIERHIVTAAIMAVDLVVVYAALSYILRRFPYTRPWGESMRGFLLQTAQNLGLGMVNALPGLFTVFLILLIARFVVRLLRFWFDAVERGQVSARWIFPDTAQPTRRLMTTLVWLLAIVVAYPYMPGSQTEAFKGVSVFVGLMFTFGSSGLVNQIMSGFMITYSRALRVGDFVRIGDVEGTVTHLGVLSTKIKTVWREEVTVPNAVVVATTTMDYSRPGDAEGVFTQTSVTIGYDTPWRQVHSLLLMAAERTPGLRLDPKPMVVQTGLEDFYVKYTLLVCLDRQEARPFTLNTLHAHIQDLFNEYGVQIMSPNYMLDPASPKVVAKKDWFAAPAFPNASAPATADQGMGTTHSAGSSLPAPFGGRPAE